MKKRLSAFAFSGVVALGLMAGSLGQAEAGTIRPAVSAPQTVDTSPIVKVQDRHYRHQRRHYRHYRHHRHYRHSAPRRYYRGGGIYFGFGTPGYYYGPRDYYDYPRYYVRPRYVAPRYAAPAYGLSSAHVRWCYNRYRSYRASDNTFQPYHGPRRQCYSPYS